MTKQQFLDLVFTTEDQFQAAAMRYINNNYPQTRKLCFHVPNESASSDLMRMKLAAKGVVPGIPDIVFVSPVFGLELKLPNGTQSPAQKIIQEQWTKAGVPYYICYTQQEFLSILENILT